MRILHVIYFIVFYLWRLLLANLRLVHEVVTPRYGMKPAIVAVDIIVDRDHEILAVANLISMTPGTLTLDISPDRKKLYIHAMYVGDEEAFRKNFRDLERRVRRMLR